MQSSKILAAVLFAATGALAATSAVAAAGDWPSQPIRLIVPYAPGGGNDGISRLVAKELEKKLGVSVVVENKGGAGGTIGVSLLKHAKPDGYTIATVPSGPLDVSPTLMGNLDYGIKDFSYIGPMVQFPLFLAVSHASGVKSVPELIAKAKSAPGAVTYSSAGIGNSTHLAGALLSHVTGTEMTHVAFRGAGPATMALMAGDVTFTFGSGPSIMQQVKSGKVLGLGVATRARLDTMPDMPTIAELGVPGFEAVAWGGLVAPKGVPPAVLQKLSVTLRQIMEDPQFRKQVVANGMLPISGSGADFEAMVRKDAAKWAGLITSANIKAQ